MRRLTELSANDDLLSLRNPATQSLFLYVMQNVHGLIKVGRSDNPQRRLLEVRKAARCAVALIAAFPDSGHFEEWVHLQLADHRVALEWFGGAPQTKAALSALLGVELRWVYALDVTGAETWTERMLDSNAQRYWRRREREMLCRLKGAATGTGTFGAYRDGSVSLEADIAPHVGFRDPVCVTADTVLGNFGDSDRMTTVPAYTRSMEAAESLWLPDSDLRVRPAFDRPVECCFLALCDRLVFDPERLTVR